MLPNKHERCQDLANPNLFNFVISIGILFGILISYLPQHIRIISRRSSEGLSPYFILLGTTSGTCAIANILVLPMSRTDISCCRVNSAFSCAAGLLGIAQVGVQWSCFFLISFLFLIFIPRFGIDHEAGNVPLEPTWRQAVSVVSIAIAHFALTFIVSIIILARFPSHLQDWADFLGLLCALLSTTQYLPQLWTTFRRKHIGSLSIPMMLIQTPGSFVFAASLAVRLGARGWSAWMVYVVTGTLQGCLLAMAIVFELRDRRQNPKQYEPDRDDEGGIHVEGEEGESDPLLGHRRPTRPFGHPLAPERLAPDPSSSEASPTEGHDARMNKTKNQDTGETRPSKQRRGSSWFGGKHQAW